MQRILLQRGEYLVEILADSFVRVPIKLNPQGYHRITSIRLILPRIVLAELNTHRLFSRNSASSRARPIAKMVKAVLEHPFIPNRFPKTHKSMQANEWVEVESPEYNLWQSAWLMARDMVVGTATFLDKMGISKQLVNRLLEPFLMHEVIITATEWANFLALRAHPAAQNEIMIAAEMILEAMNQSNPVELAPYEWHMPFGDQLDMDRLTLLSQQTGKEIDELKAMIAVARCARVSYTNFEGKDNYDADIALFKRLSQDAHWSPFEHIARAMSQQEYELYSHTYPTHTEYGWCGNFRGFVQMRKTFERAVENRPEPRLRSPVAA